VLDWISAGQPAGAIQNAITAGVSAMFDFIDAQRSAGLPVDLGSVAGFTDSSAITATSWRRGQHIYMVERVTFDAGGNPASLVLRDPYGLERTLTDPVRIYYSIGGAGTFVMP
jgi:hypothetical protein